LLNAECSRRSGTLSWEKFPRQSKRGRGFSPNTYIGICGVNIIEVAQQWQAWRARNGSSHMEAMDKDPLEIGRKR
jgi:hypothetical protein